MYSDRTEFDIGPKPTATPIVRAQQILENYLKLREKPQSDKYGLAL